MIPPGTHQFPHGTLIPEEEGLESCPGDVYPEFTRN